MRDIFGAKRDNFVTSEVFTLLEFEQLLEPRIFLRGTENVVGFRAGYNGDVFSYLSYLLIHGHWSLPLPSKEIGSSMDGLSARFELVESRFNG